MNARIYWASQGRVKLLSAAGSAAVLFDGIKESYRLARKILFLVMTLIREIITLLAILHLEIAKKTFLLPAAALSNLTHPGYALTAADSNIISTVAFHCSPP